MHCPQYRHNKHKCCNFPFQGVNVFEASVTKENRRGVLKPNSWTYNFVEVSGHNLDSSQTWSYRIQCLHYQPVSNHFCSRDGGGGGVKSVGRGDWDSKEENFCPNYVLDFCLRTGLPCTVHFQGWLVYVGLLSDCCLHVYIAETSFSFTLTQLHIPPNIPFLAPLTFISWLFANRALASYF